LLGWEATRIRTGTGCLAEAAGQRLWWNPWYDLRSLRFPLSRGPGGLPLPARPGYLGALGATGIGIVDDLRPVGGRSRLEGRLLRLTDRGDDLGAVRQARR
jgi:hypothetical protein